MCEEMREKSAKLKGRKAHNAFFDLIERIGQMQRQLILDYQLIEQYRRRLMDDHENEVLEEALQDENQKENRPLSLNAWH